MAARWRAAVRTGEACGGHTARRGEPVWGDTGGGRRQGSEEERSQGEGVRRRPGRAKSWRKTPARQRLSSCEQRRRPSLRRGRRPEPEKKGAAASRSRATGVRGEEERGGRGLV